MADFDKDQARKIDNLMRSLKRGWKAQPFHTKHECRGGPYHGETLALAGTESMVFTVNGWRGKYVAGKEKVRGGVFRNIATWEPA